LPRRRFIPAESRSTHYHKCPVCGVRFECIAVDHEDPLDLCCAECLSTGRAYRWLAELDKKRLGRVLESLDEYG